MSEERRERTNETSKLRMRKMRAKKAAAAASFPSTSKSVSTTRSVTQKKEEMREYKRNKQREYRAKMSESKKRWVRVKDRESKRKIRDNKKLKQNTATVSRDKRWKVKAVFKDPELYTRHVDDLIEKATPRKKRLLQQKGIFKKKTRNAIIKTVKEVSSVKSGKKLVIEAIRKNNDRVRKPLAKVFGIAKSSLCYKSKDRALHRIPGALRSKIEDFYKSIDVSTEIPNKRRKKSAANKPLYILQKSVAATYKEFCLLFPEAKIGIITFSKLRPVNVKLMRAMKWLQCACDLCTNMDSLLKAVRVSMYRSGIEVPNIMSGAKSLCESTLCGMYTYNSKCLDRTCSQCGLQHVVDILDSWLAVDIGSIITCRQWQTSVAIVNEREVKRVKPVSVSYTKAEAAKELKMQLRTYGKHHFVGRWQQRSYKEAVENIKDGQVIAVVDFAENYTAQRQHEAQSAYYSRNLITIHPVVCIYKVDDVVVRDSVIFISDDLKHDAAAVSKFVKGTIEHLTMSKTDLTELCIFSDGCSSQYKSKRPIQNIARRFDNPWINVVWNYFGSHHGKGPSDGETGVVKSKAARLVRSGQYVIDDAKDLFKALSEEAAILDGPSKRHIYFMPKEEIGKERELMEEREVAAVKGVRGWHQVFTHGIKTIKVRPVSCYCLGCAANGICVRGVPDGQVKVVLLGGTSSIIFDATIFY